MSIRPRQLARMGEFYLQEAILDVLCDACPEGFGIGPAEIGQRASIYRGPKDKNMNDAIVQGLLYQLRDMGKVLQAEQANRRGGWRLAESEYERRREDIELG